MRELKERGRLATQGVSSALYGVLADPETEDEIRLKKKLDCALWLSDRVVRVCAGTPARAQRRHRDVLPLRFLVY